MRSSVALLILTACSGVDEELVFGGIVIESDGGDTVTARACLGDSFGCDPSSRKLVVHHDGTATEMVYAGFIFPEHVATIPIGNALDNYQITDERGRAVIHLPPAFDLGPQEVRHLGRGDTLSLRWEPAGLPMKWTFAYACEGSNGGGWYHGGRVDDDEGALDIDMGELAGEVVADGATACSGSIVLERILHGSVKNLDAHGAAGVQRRSVPITLAL